MTSSDATTSKASTRPRRRRMGMMYIARKDVPGISDNAFRLLRRISVLTRNGEQPCNYTNAQALKELGMSASSVERGFRLLVTAGYVTVSRGHNLTTDAGRHVRTVELIAQKCKLEASHD